MWPTGSKLTPLTIGATFKNKALKTGRFSSPEGNTQIISELAGFHLPDSAYEII